MASAWACSLGRSTPSTTMVNGSPALAASMAAMAWAILVKLVDLIF